MSRTEAARLRAKAAVLRAEADDMRRDGRLREARSTFSLAKAYERDADRFERGGVVVRSQWSTTRHQPVFNREPPDDGR